MRGTRWLLLAVIAALVSGIVVKYRSQKQVIQAQAPAKPKSLPSGLNSAAERYELTNKAAGAGCPQYHIFADDYKQASDAASRVDLTNVQLEIYDKDCGKYNLFKSASAAFFPNENRLYSEGDVEITLKVPVNGKPLHQLVTIRSSGVTVDSNSGKAETDRPATFTFEHGDGKAVGAAYNPTNKELQLKTAVEVNWKAAGPRAKPMKIESASLVYQEDTSQIQLGAWGKLTRDTTVVEGENAVIQLQEIEKGEKDQRVLKQVHAVHARGNDTYPNRKLQYAADDLRMDFDNAGEVQQITGVYNARLVSTSPTAENTVTANYVVLDFLPQQTDKVLSHVTATGNGVVTSKPLPAPGKELPETHILRSDNLEMRMRPGGHEMEAVLTHAPGALEFVPNAPAQHHRMLNGNDMVIAYAAGNHIESFHSTQVRTVTDPTAEERKHNRTQSITTSNEMAARFDPKTNHMLSMEESGKFTYVEGDRNARAQKATLDSGQNVILLDAAARMWDATGSTSADRIRMDQRTGDFTAEGNVNSSRMPEKDAKKNAQMLSGDQPLQAQAERMTSTNRSRTIHYEGKVVMWQGANRLTADVVDLDREKRGLVADGHVVNNLWETPKQTDTAKAAPAPVLTVVKAPHLTYTDATRLAFYTGGVNLTRPGMQVKSHELRAYLAESGAESQLEKAFADGGVEITNIAKDHTRTGTAEHSEYYTDEQKVILKSEKPKTAMMVEMVNGARRGYLQGPELIYFANDDRLLGNGGPNQPVQSRIHRTSK